MNPIGKSLNEIVEYLTGKGIKFKIYIFESDEIWENSLKVNYFLCDKSGFIHSKWLKFDPQTKICLGR